MKYALVIGGAAGGFAEAVQAYNLRTPCQFDEVVAVKRAVERWAEPITAFASLHYETMADSIARRVERGFNADFQCFSNRPGVLLVGGRRYEVQTAYDIAGSSGGFGMMAALGPLDCERIVLAGVPIDNRPHFDSDEPLPMVERYRAGWRKHVRTFKPYARSMSGWTRMLLGEPTSAWLNGGGVRSALLKPAGEAGPVRESHLTPVKDN